MSENRNRAWRRAKNRNKGGSQNAVKDVGYKPEKNWKLMYIRSEKLKRALSLGIPYPVKTLNQMLDEEMPIDINTNEKLNLLFVCSRNQWRSPTAEKVWSKHPKLNVRSAGTSPRARKTITPKDVQWADIIFVMEKKHKNRVVAEFTRMVDHKPIHVLDIPDEYKYMDDELIELVNLSVASILGLSE